MKKRLICIVILFSVIVPHVLLSQSLTNKFALTIGGEPGADIFSSIVLANGDVAILGGTTLGDLDPNHVTSTNYNYLLGKCFVACYSPVGELKWYTQFTDTQYDYSLKISADANSNIFVGGSFNGTRTINNFSTTQTLTSNGAMDCFFMKYNSNGLLQWARSFGGVNDEYLDGFAADQNGNLVLFGTYRGTVDFNAGGGVNSMTSSTSNAFILQYDANGIFLYVSSFIQTGTSGIQCQGVSIDNANNYYFYGNFSGNLDIDPAPGTQNISSNGSGNIFIIKVNPLMQLIWGKQFDNASGDLNIIQFSNSGNLILSGVHLQTTDFDPGTSVSNLAFAGHYIATYDTAFNLINVFGIDPDNGAGMEITNVVFGPSGDYWVCGNFVYTIDVDPGPGVHNLTNTYSPQNSTDGFLVNYSSSGQFLSANVIGGIGNQEMYGMHVDNNNNELVLIGDFIGNIDLGLGAASVPADFYFGNLFCAKYYMCSPSYNVIDTTICKGQFVVSGNDTLRSGGSHINYFTAASGCDSIVTINITINHPDVSVYLIDSVFKATALNAQFQWYNCNTQSNVSGATANTFIAPDSSTYSVFVTQNSCVNSSVCMSRYESINNNIPEFDWGYYSRPDVYNDSEHLFSTDCNNNFVMGCSVPEIVDFDFSVNTFFVTPFKGSDMGVAVYSPDSKLKSVFSNGFRGYATSPRGEVTYFTKVDMQNNIIAAGGYTDAFDMDPGSGIANLPGNSNANAYMEHIFISKINESGQLIWATGIYPPVSGAFSLSTMEIDRSGSILICGGFYGDYDFDPGIDTLNLSQSTQNLDNSFVAKYTNNGDLEFAFSLFNTQSFGYVEVKSCAIDSSGNIIIGGRFSDDTDFDPGPGVFNLANNQDASFIAKYSPTGQFIWAKKISNLLESISCDISGNIFVGYDLAPYIQRYTSAGNLSASLGGVSAVGGFDLKEITVDNYGEVTFIGDFSTSITIWSDVFTTSGSSHSKTIIGRLAKDLTYKWAFELNSVSSTLHVDKARNIYLNGNFVNGPVDIDPGPDVFTVSSPNLYHNFVARYKQTCATATAITGNASLCQGSSSVLDAGAGFSAYQWSNGSTTQTISVNQPGVYFVDVTNNLGCIYRDSINVVVNPLPIATITAAGNINMCRGDSIMLTSPSGFNTYQWYRYNNILAGQTASAYEAKNGGNFKCMVTDSNNCSAFSNMIPVRIVCLPIGPDVQRIEQPDESDLLQVSVFPNPSSQEFTIQTNCDVNDKLSVRVFDGMQKQVWSNTEHESAFEIVIPELPPGVYFCSISCQMGQKTIKLVQIK